MALDAANDAFNASAGRLRKLYAIEKLSGNFLQKTTFEQVERSQRHGGQLSRRSGTSRAWRTTPGDEDFECFIQRVGLWEIYRDYSYSIRVCGCKKSGVGCYMFMIKLSETEWWRMACI